MRTVEEFAENTSLSINYDKTQVLRIGRKSESIAKVYTIKPLQWTDKTRILGINISNNYETMIKDNYEEVLTKMYKVLSAWKSRSMTMIGKIQIVNTLVMSLFTHKFSCMFSPPSNFYEKVKEGIKAFLWKKSKKGKIIAKIRYTTLIQGIAQGGLKLVDVENKNISCKMSWMHKLLSGRNYFWKEVLYDITLAPPNRLIECNPSAKQILEMTKNSKIWSEIFKNWFQLVSDNPQTVSEILSQQIWYNKFLNIKPRTSELLNGPVQQIDDLFSENTGKIMEQNEFLSLYERATFLDYAMIIKAIPKEWSNKIKNYTQIPCEQVNEQSGNQFIEKFKAQLKPTKFVYNTLINRAMYVDTARVKWNIEFRTNIDVSAWEKIREMSFKTTISVKLRWFQYRLLSNRIVTNQLRNIWDKTISPKCTFCKESKETIYHLFIDCKLIKIIWDKITHWLDYFANVKVQFNQQLIIYNNYVGQYEMFINTVILVTKQLIYAKKCQGEIPTIKEILYKIHELYLDEKFITFKNNVLSKHEKKWYLYRKFILLDV